MNIPTLLRRVAVIFERLDLQRDRDDPAAIIAAIERDAEFRGVNLWVLICAVLVASVGLNVNSTAVIIGAMLISPLMGPIIAMGVSLATYDLALLKKSSKNYGVAVLFGIVSSAIYFALSPLKEPQSELLARTSPTLWDVLIAFFGGLAGIIASTSREKKFTVIAGVAIATALMPPLCTVGYGLALQEWRFFFGAFYLLAINTVFISTAAYAVAQLLRFPNRMEGESGRQRVRRIIWAVVITTALPSIYLAWRVVDETITEQRIRRYVQAEFHLPRATVVSYQVEPSGDSTMLKVVLLGEPLDSLRIAERRQHLELYGLKRMRLEILQGSSPAISTENIRTAVLEDIYQKTERKLERLQDSLIALERALVTYRNDDTLTEQIASELPILFPEIERIALRQIVVRSPSSATVQDTMSVALFEAKHLTASRRKQFEQWLRMRTRREQLRLVAF
ncbi:MAG: membrane protein [Candidatus Kapaibacterium sp.]|nr:MAG: membrane protein [Candidatus Kapabacteria bacterium]